jgi:nitrogen fixation NifU-like protein
MYSEKIMEHYKNPRNRGLMKDATIQVDATNPICGDCTTIQMKIGDGKIEDAKFESMGCAVSVAAASMMTEFLKGKSVEEAKKFTKEDLLRMMEAELTPVKQGCAAMSVEALERALKSYEEKTKGN